MNQGPLSQNLLEMIGRVDVRKDTVLDLSHPDLNEDNVVDYVKEYINRYINAMDENPRAGRLALMKLYQVDVTNAQRFQEQKEDIEHALEVAKVDALLIMEQEPPKNMSLRGWAATEWTHNTKLSLANKLLAADSEASPEQQERTEKAIRAHLKNHIYSLDVYSTLNRVETKSGIAQSRAGQIYFEEKEAYLFKQVKEDFEAKGLGKSQQERQGVDLPYGQKLLTYMLSYASRHQFCRGRGSELKEQNLEEPILTKYNEWLWPLARQEALIELSQTYGVDLTRFNMDNDHERKEFFLNVFGAHYSKNIKNKTLGQVDLFPPTVASTVWQKEMMEASIQFMAMGGYQNKLSEVELMFTHPEGRPSQMVTEISNVLDPLIEHTKQGRPFGFKKVHLSHFYHAHELADKMKALSQNIADHPADYPHLALFEIQADQKDEINVESYTDLIDYFMSLAQRNRNPLHTDFELESINARMKSRLVDLRHDEEANRLTQHTKEEKQKLEDLFVKLDAYRLQVAKNKRTINYTILLKGEHALGQVSGVHMSSGTVKKAESIKDVRSCKRAQSLDEALKAASMEQEMSQEEEQEKSQEKEQEQEQEQEQEMNQAHGDAEDNLISEQQFLDFASQEFSQYNSRKEDLKELWHTLMGETKNSQGEYVANDNIQAMSKEVAGRILADPDVFKFGLIEGNRPEGFCYGTLQTTEGLKRGFYFDLTQEFEPTPLTTTQSEAVGKTPRMKIASSHFILHERPKDVNFAEKQMLDKFYKPVPEHHIQAYNNGSLGSRSSAAKMIFMTSSKKSGMEFYRWTQDSLTERFSNAIPAQQVAEITVAFGGDALYDLTDRMHAIKKQCSNYGQSQLFETFFDQAILQNDNKGFQDKLPWIDHLFRHDQFTALDKIQALPKDEFLTFMSFCNAQAPHQSRINFNDLYVSFKHFSEQYKSITGEPELPVEAMQALAKDCKDMKVGLDRLLFIMEKANQNGLGTEQGQSLKGLTLDYPGAYKAMKHCGYKVVLPEMGLDPQGLAKHPLGHAALNGQQLLADFKRSWEHGQEPDYTALYREFAVQNHPAKLSDFEKFTSWLTKLPTKRNPHAREIQGAMTVLASACFFHEQGAIELGNEDLYQGLVETLKGVDFNQPDQKKTLMVLIDQIYQSQRLIENSQQPLSSVRASHVTSFIKWAHQLEPLAREQGLTLETVIDVPSWVNHSQECLKPLHRLMTKESSKLTDIQVLHSLKLLQAYDTPPMSQLKGGLLQSLVVIKKPNPEFTQHLDHPGSLGHWLQQLQTNLNPQSQPQVEDVLTVLNTVKQDSLEHGPTFLQLKDMINAAVENPQVDLHSTMQWIQTQPGFEMLVFTPEHFPKVKAKAQGFDQAFAQNKAHLLQSLQGIQGVEGLHLEQAQSFDQLIGKIIEGNLHENPTLMRQAFPKFVRFAHSAHLGAMSAYPQSYPELFTKQQQDAFNHLLEQRAPFEWGHPQSLIELRQANQACQAYHQHLKQSHEQLKLLKDKFPREFKASLKALTTAQSVSIEGLSTLLKTLNEASLASEIYPQWMLEDFLRITTPHQLEGHWSTFDQIVKETVLKSSLNETQPLFELMSNLAGKNQLQKKPIESLVALTQDHYGVYEKALAHALEQIDSNPLFNFNEYTQDIHQLTEKIPSQEVQQCLSAMPPPQVVHACAQIQDASQLCDVMKVFNQSAPHSQPMDTETALAVIAQLQQISQLQLASLAELELDATFPDLTQLHDGLTRIINQSCTLDEYSQELEKEFFAAKNDPNVLKRLFDDERVMPVINQSNSLNSALPKDLPLSKKQKLLEDYSYLHAIGYDKPVYNHKPIKDLTKKELKAFRESLLIKIRDPKNSPEKQHLAMLQFLACSRETYYRATLPEGRFPYSTQMMSVLVALDNGKMNINEIATGQGKSLTAALYSSVLWAKEQSVVVCTSNLTLAHEGLEENQAFYSMMGIETGIIRAQSQGTDFKQHGIHYSDVSNMALYLAKTDIEGSLNIKEPSLILDEVDFTVLDEVTDFRYAVNLDADHLSSEVNLDEWFYYQLNDFVETDPFLNTEIDRDSDVVNAIEFMQNRLDEARKAHTIKEPFLSHVEQKLLDFQIPSSESRKKLDTWIDSAYQAKIIFEQGEGTAWTLQKERHKDGHEYSTARIISHHRIAKGSKWSKGVHQFIHARINTELVEARDIPPCRVDAEKAHVAALSSKNFIDYFITRGGAVWGMTGTVGSAQERAELQQKYGFKLSQIETHQIRTAQRLRPKFAKDHSSHVSAVFGQFKKCALDERQMPTIVVEEDAQTARLMKEGLLAKFSDKCRRLQEPPTLQFYNGIEHEVYRFNPDSRQYELEDLPVFKNSEEREDYVKREASKQNVMTITTPMMGRGTDFKPQLSAKDENGRSKPHPDGLLVIGAYVDGSEREERQIMGRMGRQGQPGIFLNVIDKKRFIKKLDDHNIKVPRKVRYFKPEKLSEHVEAYQNSVNKNLAQERQLKQTFGDIRAYFYQQFIHMLELSDPDKRYPEIVELLKSNPEFDEQAFQKTFSNRILSQWNTFLTRMDKEYMRLKDKHDDYDTLFEHFSQYCYEQWNEDIIGSLRHDCGFDDEKIKHLSDVIFVDFKAFTDHEIPEYATLKTKQADYLDQFEQRRKEREAVEEFESRLKTGLLEQAEQAPNDSMKNMLNQLATTPELMEHAVETMFPEYDKNPGPIALQEPENVNLQKYEAEFFRTNFSSQIEQSIEKGRQAVVNQDLSFAHKPLEAFVINYSKSYWKHHAHQLKDVPNPQQEIEQALAIDVLNQLQSLKNSIDKDKTLSWESPSLGQLLGFDPNASDETIQKQAVVAIQQNPTQMYQTLLEHYMRANIKAQMLRQMQDLDTKVYSQNFDQCLALQKDFLKELNPSANHLLFTTMALEQQLNTTMNQTHQVIVAQCLQDLYRDLPEQALSMTLNQPQIKPLPYSHVDIAFDIKRDLQHYLNRKDKFFKRTTNAQELMAKVAFSHSKEDLMQSLLEARAKAVQTDINKNTFFHTRNTQGSRYQQVLNKALYRVVLSADSQEEVLHCADFMRQEIAQQVKALAKSVSMSDAQMKQLFEPLGLDGDNPQPITVKEFHEAVEHYEQLIATLKASKSIKSLTESKVALNLMEQNLKTSRALLQKMESLGLGLDSQAQINSLNNQTVQVDRTVELEAQFNALKATKLSNAMDYTQMATQLSQIQFRANPRQLLGGNLRQDRNPHLDALAQFSHTLFNLPNQDELKQISVLRGFIQDYMHNNPTDPHVTQLMQDKLEELKSLEQEIKHQHDRVYVDYEVDHIPVQSNEDCLKAYQAHSKEDYTHSMQLSEQNRNRRV